MKPIFKTILSAFIIILLFSARAYSQTVYVQETGKKYHMKNCSVAGTGKKGMSIDEAKKAGYTACKVCKPDDNLVPKKPDPADKPKAIPAEQKPKSPDSLKK